MKLDLNDARFVKADVVVSTGVPSGTLGMWLDRGLVKPTVGNPGPGQARKYSAADVARIAALHGLILHGLTVSAAAEIIDQAQVTQADYWQKCLPKFAAGELRNLWVLVTVKEDGKAVHLYSGDNPVSVAATFNQKPRFAYVPEDSDAFPEPEMDHYRTAFYNVGPDVRRALKVLAEAE